ncbi:hypothetical protein AAEX28_02025 [Lentisphaerota bacterium WC36G]|nr:hypothetical protein LJT99_04910 [Lentisphaerae bacterium WC36]
MKTLIKSSVRYGTVKLIGRLLKPLAEVGVLSFPEMNEILANLKHLAKSGDLCPDVQIKLISQSEAAEILGLKLSTFRKMEREKYFTFKRRSFKKGNTVRYVNRDVIQYALSLDEDNAFDGIKE